jgi:triacylglycerol lipase
MSIERGREQDGGVESGTQAAFRLDEDQPGSRDNARFLCEASALAYLPADAGKTAFKDLLGLDATLYSVDNTQAWLATDDAAIVVAFRGTESPATIDGLKDILLTDALNLLVVPEGRLGHDLAAAGVGARFHKGFADAIAEIWPPLAEAIEAEFKRQDRPVWLTGHSLGGALALYAAWLLKRRFIPVHEVCTFGAPMIGNRVASEAFNREFAGKIFRYVNGRDPVPKLPTMSLVANEFLHVDAERLVGRDPVTRLTDLLGAVASQAAGGLLSGTLLDEAWATLNAEVSNHFLDRYREQLGGA